jgi:hypothetical protein
MTWFVRVIRLASGLVAVAASTPLVLAMFGRTEGSDVYFGSWRFPVACAFKAAYGQPCATCGMTRAWIAAAHGQFAEAATFNAHALPTFVATALVAVAFLVLAAVVRTLARFTVVGAAVAAVAALAALAALNWAVAWGPVVAKNRALLEEFASESAGASVTRRRSIP